MSTESPSSSAPTLAPAPIASRSSAEVFHYRPLLEAISTGPLAPLAAVLPQLIAKGLSDQRFGDLPAWRDAYLALPTTTPSSIDITNQVRVGTAEDCDSDTLAQIDTQLRALIPWRKGPFNVHGIEIDTEWRSDWKWDRVLPHLAPLAGRKVLDIGCGSGYHCWRMLGAGAARVIGIDPSPRFIVQFHMIKHFTDASLPIDVLPLGIEDLPPKLQAFDTVFSMGVFYHRRSPMDHLLELKELLVPGGQLVLETLVIDGELGDCLVPEGRYAMMNNVWFLPSVPTLLSWLTKMGFKNARLADLNVTTTQEQRQTDWMKFHSLAEFLDPEDSSKTAEGHPAPMRAVIIAET